MSLHRLFRYRAAIVALLLAATSSVSADPASQAKDILAETGVKGGLIVHLGCGTGEMTAALRAGDGYQVHGLAASDANVQQARKNLRKQGVYGPVSVDLFRGKQLPYVDNLVNLIVAESDAEIPRTEFLRVLVPGGVLYLRDGDDWAKTVKSKPGNTDEWTHYLHDAGGNPIAHDEQVGPPRHLQWIGSPRWSRHHDRMASLSAMVSSGGRVFYIMDEGSRVSIQLPAKWKLIARDAYNGVVLWKKEIPIWHSHLWPLKSGPTQLARRLVAVDDIVYVTLGVTAGLTALDAATGEVLQEYKDTASTEEMIVSEDTVFALVNKGKSELDGYAPEHNVGDQGRVAKEFGWDEKPRQVVAIEARTGKEKWRKDHKVAPLTLTADPKNIVFHDGDRVVCLDRNTGGEKWVSDTLGRKSFLSFNFGPRLLVYQGTVLYAGGDRKMHALDADSGEKLWEAGHERSGYQSPEDLMVAGGLVWNAATTGGNDEGKFTGRDPRTGKVVKQFDNTVDTYWFHHRCYIAKGTDNFLLTSRTGIEVVDMDKENWSINHWVRGGCLYGIMPCNGLIYAPPHNCACYPETKLFGLNALAPASPTRQLPGEISEQLEKGPAYAQVIPVNAGDSDWATYRHDGGRSGNTDAKVSADLNPAWKAEIGDRLSSVVVAEGKLFVAQIDEHTLHALDAKTGKPAWTYTTGGRIDSPPTVHNGRVLFGSMDGYAYCLRATDGELIWRFRAAPVDRRLMAFEQLESVWPVHGNILIHNGEAWFTAGRSNFLDAGLRLYRLNPVTGNQLSVTIIDETDPTNGKDLQERLEILQMPTGLSDILTGTAENVYLKSQKFDGEGKRLEIGPNSGNAAAQAAVHRGGGAHLYAPMGFVDGSWFHRSYWVFGRSFAGGHNGYYQAGKFTPAGRILVHDDKQVFGYGRLPEYLKWTTPLEHQLFAANIEPPEVPKEALGGGGRKPSSVEFAKSPKLNPAKTALTVEAWVNVQRPNGVIVSHGGPAQGYALIVRQGKPEFHLRADSEATKVVGKEAVAGKWTHVAGVLTDEGQMLLYVNGVRVGKKKAPSLITSNPAQPLAFGADDGGAVGDYRTPFGLTGTIDDVRIYHRALTEEEIGDRILKPESLTDDPKLVVSVTFDDGKPEGATTTAGTVGQGKYGNGMTFAARGGNRAGGAIVKHDWTQPVPIFARAMAKAGDTLFIAGPPDLIDEEETFNRIRAKDPEVQTLLADQDDALAGKHGAVLMAIPKSGGEPIGRVKLDSPPVWDGMAVTPGRVYVATEAGSVICLSGE